MTETATFNFDVIKPGVMAALSYDRTTTEIPEPFSDGKMIDYPHVIVGTLKVEDNGKTIGTLHFTKEGIRYEYPSAVNGKLHTIPIRRPGTGSDLLFINDDQLFTQYFAFDMAGLIAQYHATPELLEQKLCIMLQTAPKHGQAVAITPKPETGKGNEEGREPIR